MKSKKTAIYKIMSIAFAGVFLCLSLIQFPVQAYADDTGSESLTEGLAEGEYNTIDELAGKKLGVRPGSAQETYVKEYVEDPDLQYYQSFADMALALSQGKIDGFSTSSVIASGILEEYSDLTLMDEVMTYVPLYFTLGQDTEGEELRDELNSFLEEQEESGQLEEIRDRWYDGDYSQYDLGYEDLTGTNGTITVATTSGTEPYSFYYNSILTGFDIELITDFCRENGYAMKTEVIDLEGMLSGLQSGKYQIGAGSLTKTEEREKRVNFTDPYEECPIVFVVRAKDAASDTTADEQETSLWERIKANIYEEDRWQMILSGLLVTCILSVAAIIFGTLLGVLLCLGECSSIKILKKVTLLFLHFIQGLPTVLLLMLMYYVIFASVALSGVVIAAIGFTVYFAAYAADIFANGIHSVDPGQSEACHVLGLNRSQSFRKVVFPQAVNYSVAVYINMAVTIIKATSVAGYIAVQDITKISDIIRSQTFDAFIPLVISAIIYFVLCYLIRQIISLAAKHYDPNRRKPDLKGIVTDGTADNADSEAHAAASAEPVLTVEHLAKSYNNVYPIRDLSMQVAAGESICIIGPSGTGKTTLLRLICGLEKYDGGNVILHDGLKIGMVFQSFNLFPHLTVIENLMLAPVMNGISSRQEAYDEGMRLLSEFGLEDKALDYPAALSGGQKQRAAIARALAVDPDILLFDEPTSALDPAMVYEVMDILRQLSLMGITILTVTHEMKLVRNIASRVIFLSNGGICEEGSPDKIFESPEKPETKAFLQEHKKLSLTLPMANFNYMRVMGEVERFAHRHISSFKLSYHLQLCIEEILSEGFLNEPVEWIRLVIVEGSQKSVTLSFSYPGGLDIRDRMDSLSSKLIAGVISSSEFTTDGPESTLTFKII